MEGLDVVPSLLEEADKEVDRDGQVLAELFGGMVGTANSGGEAGNLLQLEFNRMLHIRVLAGNGLTLLDGKGEFTTLDELPPHELRQLLHELLRGEEHTEGLGPLLNLLLVLLECLHVVLVKGGDVDGLGLFDVTDLSENSDLVTSISKPPPIL